MAVWSSNPRSPCRLNSRSYPLFSCKNQHNVIMSAQCKQILKEACLAVPTSASAPVSVSSLPVAEGWGWRRCPPLLSPAVRSTSHCYTSVGSSTTTESRYMHLSRFKIIKGFLVTTKDHHLLLWCAGSLWHQNWLQLPGRDSPHPELRSNSHSSLLQTLRVWTGETEGGKHASVMVTVIKNTACPHKY